MCGNFGLLSLGSSRPTDTSSHHNDSFHKPLVAKNDLDRSMTESMHQVSKLQGIRVREETEDAVSAEEMLSPLKILEAQTANTEIRGGQAGGYSSIEYTYAKTEHQSRFDALFSPSVVTIPTTTRVRKVARKRHPLAADLSALYLAERRGREPDPKTTITVIGHTRFATSSVNLESELHPHEWVPFHKETVWLFNAARGRFEKSSATVGIHISHNGDFDALDAFSQTMVNEEVGLFLERVLHCPNHTRGDSPKIAGSMDLLRVQGRWDAAARLAWVRCVLSTATDVSQGEQLCKSAPNTFPGAHYWSLWGEILDKLWSAHINNIVKVISPSKFESNQQKKRHRYKIDAEGVKQFLSVAASLFTESSQDCETTRKTLGISDWTPLQLQSFLHHAVRGFLHADLYTALTELLSRAEGSFGVQVHCTIEPGVVVIASKGQPMSVAFDPARPIVLFASEAEALAVPVYKSGKWLPERIDLDSKGEIFRLGEPRALWEGHFSGENKKNATATNNAQGKNKEKEKLKIVVEASLRDKHSLLLDCGVEIRSYSLVSCVENSAAVMTGRSVTIRAAPLPYDPKVDLVAADLRVTTAVLNAIDLAWANPFSIERISGQSLAEHLVQAMRQRMRDNLDTTDLLIGGVEVSLWLGEQFAADMRRIFPKLNITTVSTNKLLGVCNDNPNKVLFSGADEVLPRRITSSTCVLLISQSGQTFPTLHATRKLAQLVPQKLWILTGCFHSKMETALVESYTEKGLVYGKDRVFNNYSGHRPAEPASVAVAASWHSLTRLLLHTVAVTRSLCRAHCAIHPWEREHFVRVIQRALRRFYALRRRHSPEKTMTTRETNPMRAQANLSVSVSQIQRPPLLMTLTDGCVADILSLLSDNLVPNVAQITGFDHFGNQIEKDEENAQQSGRKEGKESSLSTHARLVAQGEAWAAHVNETWHVAIAVAVYLFLSIGLNLQVCSLIGDAILAIVRAGAENNETAMRRIGAHGMLAFTPRFPHLIYDQGVGYTLIGVVLQFCDALVFIFLVKIFTALTRWWHGRPLAARIGKRTIVVVDSPSVHQLVESFASKLFSQAYSFLGVEVHGASGLDHFVHRFTHRVVRGTLLAVGRPDGRMCCLAKSEASILLAVKQAAFIRNPDYRCAGSGPDIVTIGHNPFSPDLGVHSHIVLHDGGHYHVVAKSTHNTSTHHNSTHNDLGGGAQVVIRPWNRRKFVDEYLYDRLFLAKKPFTASILRSLRRAMETDGGIVRSRPSMPTAVKNPLSAPRRRSYLSHPDEPLPYGAHHIDPAVLQQSLSPEYTVFADFVANNWENLNKKVMDKLADSTSSSSSTIVKSNDPNVRLAFSSKLDRTTREVQDLQVHVQQFYECRVAALERYIAFCVMFHAMAAKCARPWFLHAWDIARSQSNLRVATTASPIGASGEEDHGSSQEVKKLAHRLAFTLRKVKQNF